MPIRATTPFLGLALLLAGASAAPAGPIRLEDASTAAGLDFVHFNAMVGDFYLGEIMGSGGALVDYDGDGDLDLYLRQGAPLGSDAPADALFPPRHPLPLTDRLYRNDLRLGGDGQPTVALADVTAAAGLGSTTGYGMGIAAGDVDGDGDTDLYLTDLGPNALLLNRGDGGFAPAPAAGGADDARWSVAASLFDADADGDLDLYVGNYVAWTPAAHRICPAVSGQDDWCGPLTFPPVPDRMFANRGDGRFEDVTSEALGSPDPRTTMGSVSGDFDGDGRLDLYVANDLMPNHLWLGRGDGTFSDEALLGGCATDGDGGLESSMGLVAGDLDVDADEDLFVTHVAEQTHTLYVNDGGALFFDRSRESGIAAASGSRTGFGAVGPDLDLDGHPDLLLAAGTVNVIEAQRRSGEPYPARQPNQLLRGVGGGRYEDVTTSAGPALALPEVSRGLAVGDVDLDGADDVLLTNSAGPARLLLNRTADRGGWLAVRVVDEVGADALGSELRLTPAGGGARLGRVRTDGSYASASSPVVRFGLGAVERADLRVTRPGGGTTEWRGLAAGRTYVLPAPAAPGGDPR